MTGTPNNPTFTMTCTIGEKTFSGTGRSKKEAKLAASQLVLQEMFGKDFSGGSEADDGGQGSSLSPEPEVRDWLELEGKRLEASTAQEGDPGAELLKNNWFCKLFGVLEGGIVEKPLVL